MCILLRIYAEYCWVKVWNGQCFTNDFRQAYYDYEDNLSVVLHQQKELAPEAGYIYSLQNLREDEIL